MGNLVLNKPATASSYVKPYTAARAVNGSAAAVQRWLSNTVPCWLSVNLQGRYWINRWVLKHMGVSGWSSPAYNMSDYKLQGSLDNANWFDLDIVTGNGVASTDRTFNAVQVSYVRVYVTKGININPKMASIAELEVYEAPPTSPYLQNLTLSKGTLTPTFVKTQLNYTASVVYDVTQITVTPTAEDPGATIKVNGVVVPSGQVSAPINLVPGTNTITVQVTSKIGGLVQNYSIVVTRASSSNLSGLVVNAGTTPVTLNPTFDKSIISYTANVGYDVAQVTIAPTAEDPNATVKVNGTVVPYGQASAPISLNVGNNPIAVEVTSQIGGTVKTYTVNLTRASSPYLTNLVVQISSTKPALGMTPTPFAKATYAYTVTPVSNTVASVIVTPTAESPTNATIKVNGTVVASGTASAPVSLIVGDNTITVDVISGVGVDTRTYTLLINRRSI